MPSLSKKNRANLVKLLQEGKDIPEKYKDILFGAKETQKEYELTYAEKAREEDVIAETLAAPLQEVRTFNSDNKFNDNWTNKLIFGDNLMALKNLYEDPNIKGKVKLIYIDPPFATKQDFKSQYDEKAYQDKIAGAKFLNFLRKRLIVLRELLASDGSLFVHLDWRKAHYVKVILDEVFSESRFKGDIIWHYFTGVRTLKYFNRKHDILLWYTKSSEGFYFDQQSDIRILPYKPNMIDKMGKVEEIPCSTCNNGSGIFRNTVRSGDVWDIQQVFNMSREYIEYPTQKPEQLLEKIVRACSSEDSIILDAFAGSGTTLAVAEKLKRRWIGIDCGKLSLYTMQKRMLNLHEQIGNKGKSIKSKAFTLYNAGLYDWHAVKKLDYSHYRDFVLKLFQVREGSHEIRGIKIDGYVGDSSAYLWDHSQNKGAKLDNEFLVTLHEALGGNGGEIFYIIAPANSFSFFEDEIKIDSTIYKTLRVPQSVIVELIKRGGEALKQPTSEQDVNDTIDSVGFDFIQTPEVEVEYLRATPKETTLFNQRKKDYLIKLKSFRSRTLTKSPEEFENYETLSMIMVDYNYDGKVFDLDNVFYADSIKPEFEIRFDGTKLGAKVMIIYLDIYGNEKKEVLTLKAFK